MFARSNSHTVTRFYRIDVECFMELFDCSQTEAYIAKQLRYAGGNE